MKRIEVRFDVDVPDDMPWQQAEEWIAFEVGARGEMRVVHPQMEKDLEIVPGSFKARC